MIEIKRVGAEELYPIRLEVLRNGSKNTEDAVFAGDDAPMTMHAGIYCDELAGCVSVMEEYSEEISRIADGVEIKTDAVRNAGFGKLLMRMRGLAVYEKFRGQGLSFSLVRYAEFFAFAEKGAAVLWLNAREHVVGLYEKMGYKKLGEPFNIENVGMHYLMYKPASEYSAGCKGCAK